MQQVTRAHAIAGLTVVLACASLTASAATNHYRWIDERGDTVMSDRPPAAGIEYEVISVGSNLVQPVDDEEAEDAEQAEPASEQSNPTTGASSEPTYVKTKIKEPEKDPALCEQAKQNLDILKTSPRIRMRREDGEVAYMSDEDKAEQSKRAENIIAIHCE